MNQASKNLLIVDDHQVIGELIERLFMDSDRFKICSINTSVKEAKEALKKHRIDVAIIDISLEEDCGLELIEYTKTNYPNVGVLVFTMHMDSQIIADALARGANGYLPKSSSLKKLQEAVYEVSLGNRYLSSEITGKLIDGLADIKEKSQIEAKASQLTKREKEVLKEVLNGKTNKAISNKLDISLRTVENHRANILRKMGVSNFYSLLYLKK